MRTMTCDKCDKDVPPSNNAKVYDAALAALSNYESKSSTIATVFGGDTVPTFRNGEVVAGDARESIENVLSAHNRGRHFHVTDGCEGSPSRRKNVEEGRWANEEEMDSQIAANAKLAYELMQTISS